MFTYANRALSRSNIIRKAKGASMASPNVPGIWDGPMWWWSTMMMMMMMSGAGVRRPGFERLLASICEGRIGAVLTIEVSRLARNGRDWHPLLEFLRSCYCNCLILDEDSVYDPRMANDGLELGMKGTMSEMELSLTRQRLTGGYEI
jgi:hypothetical protein